MDTTPSSVSSQEKLAAALSCFLFFVPLLMNVKTPFVVKYMKQGFAVNVVEILLSIIASFFWMILNVVGWSLHWDVYPFILLNLLFSTQAAYAAPIIMMSQNRQSERDRANAEADYKTNLDAKSEIEELQRRLNAIEVNKLDKIIELLEGTRWK